MLLLDYLLFSVDLLSNKKIESTAQKTFSFKKSKPIKEITGEELFALTDNFTKKKEIVYLAILAWEKGSIEAKGWLEGITNWDLDNVLFPTDYKDKINKIISQSLQISKPSGEISIIEDKEGWGIESTTEIKK